MTPEQLARYRAEKLEKKNEAAAARERAEEAEKVGRANQAHLAETVLREQIIPYFGRVKVAMTQGFSYEVVQNTQKQVVGVNISLDGISGKISVRDGSYQVQLRDPKTARYNTYPNLGAPEDVSEASLGNLLKALIDQK
jgi:hypothetical protein